MLAFIAEQIGAFPASIDEYLTNERNRQRHAIECQEQIELRYFGRQATTELTETLLPQVMEDDRLAHLAALAMEACRQRRIICPSPLALERLCAELRHQGRREEYRRLINGLFAEQRKSLGALTRRRDEADQVWLTWLRQIPEAAKPNAMLGVIERLEHVRTIGIDLSRGHLIHQARLSQRAREADKTTVQHVARFQRQHRHATLVAITLDFTANLTDQAINLFDRLVGGIFRKAPKGGMRAPSRRMPEQSTRRFASTRASEPR